MLSLGLIGFCGLRLVCRGLLSSLVIGDWIDRLYGFDLARIGLRLWLWGVEALVLGMRWFVGGMLRVILLDLGQIW